MPVIPARGLIDAAALAHRGLEAPEHSHDDAADLRGAGCDAPHAAVGRLEADPVLLAEITLERRLSVLEDRDDHIAVLRALALLDDDVVPVGDMLIRHRVA